MYLSRLEINPLRREARRLMANPQALHATIMKTFDPKEDHRILWRVDEGENDVVMYVVSPDPASLESLQKEIGWQESVAKQTDYQPFLEGLADGGEFAFRMTGNPTHIVTENGVKKRFGHVTVEHQKDWFLNKADANGFSVRDKKLSDDAEPFCDLLVSDRKTVTFRRKNRPVTLTMATFTGTLRVEDADQLRSALVNGIGRAKAYGCGLLTLAKP